MAPSSRTTFASLLIFFALLLASTVALAAPKDAAAKKLDAAAMNEDFLAVKFSKAEDKLRRALKACGKNGCSPKVEGQLHLHLGIILVNEGKDDLAKAAFVHALRLVPTITPDSDYASPEVNEAFERAKRKQGGGAAGPSIPSSGDLKHTPIAEAKTHLPIPIFVEGDPSTSKVVVHYQPPEADNWKRIRLKKKRKGWGAVIPCGDTADVGELHYYLVAEDADGSPVGNVGTKSQPLTIALRRKISGEQPSFPGEDPPEDCGGDKDAGGAAEGDDADLLDEGADCNRPNQCRKGLFCVDGTCEKKHVEEPPSPYSTTWLSLGLSLDAALLTGGNPCTAAGYDSGKYDCYRSDGRFYKPAGSSADAGSGFAIGTTRILVGIDQIVFGNLAVGVRFGYAFGGGPDVPSRAGKQSFFPWHFEPRVTYWIGDGVLMREGIRPYVFAGGGVAEVDAKLSGIEASNDCELQGLCNGPRTPQTLAFNTDGTIRTHADGSPVFITPSGRDVSTLPAKTSNKITVDAWRKMGTSFLGIGGGAMYAFGKSAGITLDLKIAYYLGSTGVAISPTLGGIVGF